MKMIETLIEHQQRTSMSVLEACQSTGLKKTVFGKREAKQVWNLTVFSKHRGPFNAVHHPDRLCHIWIS